MSLLVAAVLALATQARGGIEWEAGYEQARERAKSSRMPVFIAVNMDGERANDAMVRDVYPDPLIVALSRHTVNLFASAADHGFDDAPCRRAGNVSCSVHRAVDKAVRREVLLADESSHVIAPQHVFLSPDGAVLISVPYQVTAAELEWCFVEALRAVDPASPKRASAAARAPRRLLVGKVAPPDADAASAPPPTAEEVEEILDRLNRGERPWEMRDDIARLLRSDDERVESAISSLLSSRFATRQGARAQLLHSIGRLSPAEFWHVVAPWLDDPDVAVRREAAVALEQLAAPKASSALLKRFGKEKDAAVRADLVRAIAACGPDQKKSVGLVLEQARKAREDGVRTNAVIGAAHLADAVAVIDLARAALADPLPSIRVAGAYIAAIRREKDLLAPLEQLALLESDASLKEAYEQCLEVLRGAADAATLDAVLRRNGGSDIPRDRR
jgi:hypothetical protein